jgi:hypothetical protein
MMNFFAEHLNKRESTITRNRRQAMGSTKAKTLIFTALLLGLTAAQASASSYTYDLTRWISGGTYGPLASSLGTVTIADDANPNKVDVTVALNSGLNLLSFDLNYYGHPVPDGYLDITGGKIDIVYDSNAFQMDGYTAGKFDIAVPDSGNLPGNIAYYYGVMSDSHGNNTVDLDAINFNNTDSSGVFHVAAHIGKGSSTLPNGEESIFVGDGPAPVPEPGTMMLLGAGFLGLAVYGKRRKNA